MNDFLAARAAKNKDFKAWGGLPEGVPIWKGFGKDLDELGSSDLETCDFQAVIKSAASTASPKSRIQESRGQGSLAVSVARQPSRCLLAPLDSWTLVFGEAALAGDLITA